MKSRRFHFSSFNSNIKMFYIKLRQRSNFQRVKNSLEAAGLQEGELQEEELQEGELQEEKLQEEELQE